MKVTALGTGGAFSGLFGESKGNTCFVLDADKCYMIDCPKDISVFGDARMPVKIKSIDDVIITHMHSDHIGDLGSLLFEKKFVEGKKLRLHATRGLYAQIKRRLSDELAGEFTRPDMLTYTEYSFEDFVDFKELSTNVPFVRDGVKIDVRYNWHPTRPENTEPTTIGLKIAYESATFAYSSDTKYDLQLSNELFRRKTISKKQWEDLKGFLWDADFIVHEATQNAGKPGVGNIHTMLDALKGLPEEVRRKVYVAHTDDITPVHLEGTKLRLMERFKTYKVGGTF